MTLQILIIFKRKKFIIIIIKFIYYLIASKIQEKGPSESLRCKVIFNSSFMPSNVLCVARNLERKQTSCSKRQ